MNILDLNGEWRLKKIGGDIEIPATVPGLVQLDLLKKRLINEPNHLENELSTRWVGLSDLSLIHI